MEFKKILVPVDGSDPSMNAFHCALDLAKAHKTEMILLYVIDANEMFYATNQVMLSGEFFETMKGVGTKLIEKLVSEIPEDVPHKSICVVGIPGETASDIAKSEEVDLIVMGNSGKGRIQCFRHRQCQPVRHPPRRMPGSDCQVIRVYKRIRMFLPEK